MGELPVTLVDSFGRIHRDLRVSLTDRCNLRCTYCMPEDFGAWTPNAHLLTRAEIVRVIRVAVECGVSAVRLTGGEPLLHPEVVDIVRDIACLPNAPKIALTTNGLLLERLAGPLANAGLDRVNISLDTLDRQRFAEITKRDRLKDVLAGIAAAQDAGLTPIKINTVLMRGVNDTEAADLLRKAIAQGWSLRFIEQMPLDAGGIWSRATMVTADGQVRNCLFARSESDLRGILRDSLLTEDLRDEAISRVLGTSVQAKLAGHGIEDPLFLQPARPMSAIGG